MGKKSPAPVGPDHEGDPREIAVDAAAPNQIEVTLEPIQLDDTAAVPIEPSPGPDAPHELADAAVNGARLKDTGWYESDGWQVRVVVVGATPDQSRRRWFQGMLKGR